MPKILPISALKPNDIPSNAFIVYGGSFDPIHAGHVSLIRALCAVFQKVLIAPTDQNPWKEQAPCPLDLRIEMIRKVLTAEGLACSGKGKIEISSFAYAYTEDLVKHLQETRAGEIYWAIGEDSKDGVTKWRNWEKLPITLITVPITIDTHSTDVHLGNAEIHPAIAEFAEKNGLYRARKA